MKIATINWKNAQYGTDIDGWVSDIILFEIQKRGKRKVKYILQGRPFYNGIFPRANTTRILAASDSVEKLKIHAQKLFNDFVEDFIEPDKKPLEPATLTMLTMYHHQANPIISVESVDVLLNIARKFEKKYRELNGKDWERSKVDWETAIINFYNDNIPSSWNKID